MNVNVTIMTKHINPGLIREDQWIQASTGKDEESTDCITFARVTPLHLQMAKTPQSVPSDHQVSILVYSHVCIIGS